MIRSLALATLLLGGIGPPAPEAAQPAPAPATAPNATQPASAAARAMPTQPAAIAVAQPGPGAASNATQPGSAAATATPTQPAAIAVAQPEPGAAPNATQPEPAATPATQPQPAAAPPTQPEPGAAPEGPASEAADVDEQATDDGWDFEDDDDGWGFEDEEGDDPWSFADDEADAETWTTLLRDQAADLAFFSGFAALVLVGFFRKSVWMKYVTLGAAVAYMGFTKSQLISVVNVYGLVTGNMPVFRYSLAWYLFAVFTVVTTVLWGRLYCGRVCAFGALTQLMDRVVPARLRVEVPAWLEERAAWIKYGLLAATLTYFLATADIPAYRWVEPFWMFTRRGTAAMWIALAVLLAATVFVRNLYCRFLCPVGAFLGVLSKLTVFRIKRWKECDTCKICEKACEWGAIQGPRIVMTECVRCDDCERLYADVKKCPHWLLLLRAKRRQRQAAPSVIPVRPVAST